MLSSEYLHFAVANFLYNWYIMLKIISPSCDRESFKHSRRWCLKVTRDKESFKHSRLMLKGKFDWPGVHITCSVLKTNLKYGVFTVIGLYITISLKWKKKIYFTLIYFKILVWITLKSQTQMGKACHKSVTCKRLQVELFDYKICCMRLRRFDRMKS